MSSDLIPPQERLAAWNVLARDWAPFLDPLEHYVLLRLFDASIEWGYDCLDATFGQLAEGTRGRGDNAHRWRIAPLKIARRTFYKILDGLKKSGVLLVEVAKASATRASFTRFTINKSWSPEAGVPSMEDVMAPRVPTPKRLQGKVEEPADEFNDWLVHQRHTPCAPAAHPLCTSGTPPVHQRHSL